jgi:hypothetical protein
MALLMTALMLAIDGFQWEQDAFPELVFLILSGTMLLFHSWAKHPFPWLIIFCFMAGSLWIWRNSADNHKYLFAYWVLAGALAYPSGNAKATLAFNARYLIAGAFGWAVMWKVGLGEFTDGRFFYYTFLEDSRFEAVARYIGGVPVQDWGRFQDYLQVIKYYPGVEGLKAVLPHYPSLWQASLAISYWTLGIEGLIALGFLCSHRRGMLWVGQTALLIFILTTYPIAPVRMFAALLALMGFASTRDDQPRLRLVFLAVFLLTPLISLSNEVRDALLEA